MAAWQFVLGPATGGQTAALTTALNRKVSFKLTEPSEASFSINGRQAEAAAIGELTTDLHCIRDQRLLYRGRIGQTSDNLDATTHRIDVASKDYRELLNRRMLYAEDQRVFGATDQAAIVWSLLSATQNRPGGNLGIVRGAGQVSGIPRDRSSLAAGDMVGAAITELAQLVNGFDWDIVPADATTLRLDMWHGDAGRGADRGVVLEYGGNVTGLQRTVGVDTYANAVRVTGSTSTLVELRPATDIATRPEGRWDQVYGYTELVNQSQLAERADWQLADAETITPTYTMALKADTWTGPDHIWLGDWVRLRVKSGRLAVDTPLRVYQIDVDITAANETVSLTLGGPQPDYRRRPIDLLRRLRTLETR